MKPGRITINTTPARAAAVKIHAKGRYQTVSKYVCQLIDQDMAAAYPERLDEKPAKFLAAEESTPIPPATLAQAVAAKERAAAALTTGNAPKRVGDLETKSDNPATSSESTQPAAAFDESISRRVKAARAIANRIRNQHPEQK